MLWSLLAFGASSALAHGELILQLGAEQVQPGGSIEVRGDLGTGESFEVALISKADGSRRLIATIPAVEEGHFQTFVTIPADLAPGAYLLEVAVDLIVARAPLSVVGSPITGEGGGDGPDHADPLVQPMPGSSPAVSGANAAGLTGSAAPGAPVSTRAGRSAFDGLIIVAVAVLGAVALAIVVRLAGQRGAQGRSGDAKRG